jgi:hypothetical protein
VRPTGTEVKDSRQAILRARAAFYCVHWSSSKYSESEWLANYEAYNKGQIWYVSGIIGERFAGGGPYVEIAAQDGRVLDMLQTQWDCGNFPCASQVESIRWHGRVAIFWPLQIHYHTEKNNLLIDALSSSLVVWESPTINIRRNHHRHTLVAFEGKPFSGHQSLYRANRIEQQLLSQGRQRLDIQFLYGIHLRLPQEEVDTWKLFHCTWRSSAFG